MLTLPQIVQRTAGRRKESAKYVKIVYVKKGWDSLGRGFVACASYSTKIWSPLKQRFVKNTTGPNGKPRRYVTVIVFLDPRLHVISSCSCADFKYRWEVALNHKQAAEIEYSNGELPVIRNPSMRAAQCKHLIALYWHIEPHLPKPKRNDKTPPINPPQVATPPSVLKKQAEEEAERKKALITPIKIKAPKNVQRSVKPGKKQSTLPRPKPAPTPPPKVAPKIVPPPAKMTTKSPAKPAQKSKPAPAMMKAPARKAPKVVAPPAMMRAKPPAQPAAKSAPAMMRAPAKTVPARPARGPAAMKARK